MLQLEETVTELEQWKQGRGVILRGAQEAFCSGGDLTLMKSMMETLEGPDMSRFMQTVLTRFYQLPLVTVAYVEGMFCCVIFFIVFFIYLFRFGNRFSLSEWHVAVDNAVNS